MIRKILLTLSLMALVCSAAPALAEDTATLINVNTATAEQLATVPGMTEDIATGILSYRQDMGDIQSMDELLEVKGVNKDLLEQFKTRMGLDALSGAECSC